MAKNISDNSPNKGGSVDLSSSHEGNVNMLLSGWPPTTELAAGESLTEIYGQNDSNSDRQLPSSTLKRHPKMDLNKNDLLRLLSYLEGELQARDVTIATLKAEKAKQMLYQAKYGRFGMDDPFQALQRDSDSQKDETFDEGAIKSMYDNQLSQLENLIATQQKAQLKMREQLTAVEKKYHKACSELSEEKQKHAQDTADGDDVTYLLEKERERLKKEIDFEKNQNKKLEKELKKVTSAYEEEKQTSTKHKQVALLLIKERRQLSSTVPDQQILNEFSQALKHLEAENNMLANELKKEKEKNCRIEKSLKEESGRMMKAAFADGNKKPSIKVDKGHDGATSRVEKSSHLKQPECRSVSPAQGDNESKRQTLKYVSKGHEERNSNSLPNQPGLQPVNSSSMSSNKSMSSSSGGAVKKTSPMVRGVPPPVPPNKPSYVPQPLSVRKDMYSRPAPVGNSSKLASSSAASKSGTKDGKDEMTTPGVSSGALYGTPDSGKPSQCGPQDSLSQEMANLQQLLVSMVAPVSPEVTPMSRLSSYTSVCNQLVSLISSCDTKKFRSKYLETFNEISVNETINEHSRLLCAAAEFNQFEVLEFLLGQGCSADLQTPNAPPPIHVAATEGNIACVELLLKSGANVNSTDSSDWTALHSAANHGSVPLCHLLLEHGARVDSLSSSSWTPLHNAVHSRKVEVLQLLLSNSGTMANIVVNTPDCDGWTLAHLAAIQDSTECLKVLVHSSNVDLSLIDKWGRTVSEVASPQCRDYLHTIMSPQLNHICECSVLVSTDSNEVFSIGKICIESTWNWHLVEDRLEQLLLNHFEMLSFGLQAGRRSKLDPGESLGLSLQSVASFSIGNLKCQPGVMVSLSQKPYSLIRTNQIESIYINLKGDEDVCYDSLSYAELMPISCLQNHVRLVESYKNVMFYGFKGCGKSYTAKLLAKCIQTEEERQHRHCQIHSVVTTASFGSQQLVKLLIEKSCLLPIMQPDSGLLSPILVFDDLEKLNMKLVFSDILPILEHRGPGNPVQIRLNDMSEPKSFYLIDTCYFIGTLNCDRLTNLDASVQQHFRWVHLSMNVEPSRSMLPRLLYRKVLDRHEGLMPAPDNALLVAVQWVASVWYRLNDGLTKLGLKNFGFSQFLSCPIEVDKPGPIYKWMCSLWNHEIAPAVVSNLGQGMPSKFNMEQEKVANTALYVLMQRSVVVGCPLSGQERDRYLPNFTGSNQLDIKMHTKPRVKSPMKIASPKDMSIPADMRS